MDLKNLRPSASYRRLQGSVALAGLFALLATAVQGASSAARAPRRADFTWVRTLSQGNDVSINSERAKALAFDSVGNVLAAGHTEIPQGPLGTSFFTVAKWTPKGVLRWARTLSDAELTRSEALSVTAAPDDSVVAGGRLVDANGNQQFTVAKWSADGVQQWVKRFDRSTTSPEQARLVAIDPAGDVIAVGDSFSDDTAWDTAIYKLRGTDGELLWSKHYDGAERSFDEPRALVVNGAGDLFIGGEIGNLTGSYCAVMKVRGTDGERLWTNSLDRPNAFGGGEAVNSVALTANGDVVACGNAYGGFETGTDWMIGRFDGETGEREWQTFVDSPVGQHDDEAIAITVDSHDDVLTAGNSPDIAGNYALLVKLTGSNGLEQWRKRLPMPTEDPDFSAQAAIALAVDDRDHAFLACQRFGSSDAFDALVAEWDGTGEFVNLRQLPEARATSDELISTVAVDRRGNLAAAGELDRNFAVAYRASNRVERLVVQPARLTFGRVDVGEEQSRSFLLRNTGTAPLTARLTSANPQFRPVGPCGPTTTLDLQVPARDSIRVVVRFTPTTKGRRSAILTLTTSDPRRPTVRLPATGIGKPAPPKG